MFILRNNRPEDFKSIVRIERQCFEPCLAWNTKQYREALKATDARMLVADAAGTMAGYVLTDVADSDVAHISTLNVAKAFRRHGVARELLTWTHEYYYYRNFHSISLEVNVKNEAAINLYRKFLYRIVSKIDDYYYTGEHAYVMIKILKGETWKH